MWSPLLDSAEERRRGMEDLSAERPELLSLDISTLNGWELLEKLGEGCACAR